MRNQRDIMVAMRSSLKMEAICSSETSVDYQRTTLRYLYENLKPYMECDVMMILPSNEYLT
jgi:hypothetical protein